MPDELQEVEEDQEEEPTKSRWLNVKTLERVLLAVFGFLGALMLNSMIDQGKSITRLETELKAVRADRDDDKAQWRVLANYDRSIGELSVRTEAMARLLQIPGILSPIAEEIEDKDVKVIEEFQHRPTPKPDPAGMEPEAIPPPPTPTVDASTQPQEQEHGQQQDFRDILDKLEHLEQNQTPDEFRNRAIEQHQQQRKMGH